MVQGWYVRAPGLAPGVVPGDEGSISLPLLPVPYLGIVTCRCFCLYITGSVEYCLVTRYTVTAPQDSLWLQQTDLVSGLWLVLRLGSF